MNKSAAAMTGARRGISQAIAIRLARDLGCVVPAAPGPSSTEIQRFVDRRETGLHCVLLTSAMFTAQCFIGRQHSRPLPEPVAGQVHGKLDAAIMR